MNSSRSRLILGFVFAILTSAMAGGLLARWWTLREMDANRARFIAEKMQIHLTLSDEQTRGVAAQVQTITLRMRQSPPRDLRGIAESRRELTNSLRSMLTPEQRRRYDEFNASLANPAIP